MTAIMLNQEQPQKQRAGRNGEREAAPDPGLKAPRRGQPEHEKGHRGNREFDCRPLAARGSEPNGRLQEGADIEGGAAKCLTGLAATGLDQGVIAGRLRIARDGIDS